MNINSKLHFFFLLGSFLLLYSCIDRETYPIEPVITYKTFYIVEDSISAQETGVIVISFTDGNGDIGLNPSDTIAPYHSGGDYYFNFVLYFYKSQGADFVRIDIPYSSRIPPINPDDFDQNLKGEIYWEIDLAILRAALPDKRFKFEAFIYDRALNKSNTIMSPVINLP